MEEGREGELQQAGGSQEKGQLERSEKEELKDLGEEPLRRTRTLERQVRGPHPPYHTHCCQLAENSAIYLKRGRIKSGLAGRFCGPIRADFVQNRAEYLLESSFSTHILCKSKKYYTFPTDIDKDSFEKAQMPSKRENH
jgi:hypothetical protein